MRFILALFLLLAAFGTVSVQAKEETPAVRTAAKQGWKKVGGKKYYIGADGKAVTGLQKIGGKYYCFNKKGQMLKNKPAYQVGKNYYVIDSKGVARKMSEAEELAVRQLKKLSKQKLRAAFDWAAKLPYQVISTSGKTPQDFASYGFSYGRGDCNVQACTFCYMAKVLGYDGSSGERHGWKACVGGDRHKRENLCVRSESGRAVCVCVRKKYRMEVPVWRKAYL